MSILKQVLSEAWSSVLRKSPAERPRTVTENRPTPAFALQKREGPSGLKVVILNWKAGENDPFTVINGTIRQHFQACGKNVEILEITEDDWPKRLDEFGPIEFVFTWQGLGSSVKIRSREESLWDHLRIPLICVHGDHPCHMPLNHQLESQYCFHLYTNADFARYSNRHFRRLRGASVIDLPQLHREPHLEGRSGDYFVVAKNINDPQDTERSWRERLPQTVFNMFMMAAETLRSRITRESYVEIHDVLDALIVECNVEWLTPESNSVGYHDYHSQLDHYVRSHKTVAAVTALRDFPLRIYGRGWDRILKNAPAHHTFERGCKMADSQHLYYSRFGLVDISPSKALHDRTRRAMANRVGFLSSANLEDTLPDLRPFETLFFSFRPNDLPEKAAAVMRDPNAHAALAQQFAHTYNNKFHFRAFVTRLDDLAKLASPHYGAEQHSGSIGRP